MITTNVPGMPPIELVAYYDEFLFYYENCELETKGWFVEQAQPDWVYFDCGANIGYYSILFSRLSPDGRIFAFEPTSTVEKLRANLDHHAIANVEVLPVALGARSGAIADGIFRIWGAEAERRVYDFTTVDDFVDRRGLDRVDCIKIDVDSFDFEVLQGAQRTMERFDPYVVVELNHALSRRQQSNVEALHWLGRQGYTRALVLDHDNFVMRRGGTPAAAAHEDDVTFTLLIRNDRRR